MRALSLFTGCGGLDLAAEMAGMEIVGQCEIDKDCRAVLRRHWPAVKLWEDVRALGAESIRAAGIGHIDGIIGGPPCQPVSVAGRREAAGDSRNMWPEYIRLLCEIGPRWFVAENPTGILTAPRRKGEPKGTFFGDILGEMDALGYVVGWGVWGACDVEGDESGAVGPAESGACAPHIRERVFMFGCRTLANGEGIGRSPRRAEQPGQQGVCESAGGGTGVMADTHGQWQPQSGRDVNQVRGWTGDGGNVADAEQSGLQRRAQDHQAASDRVERCGSHVGNSTSERGSPGVTDSSGGQERNPTKLDYSGCHVGNTIIQPPRLHVIDGRPGTGEDDALSSAGGRSTQSGLGGDADGRTYRLDFAGWSAGRGAEQFDWEPPRVVPRGIKGRGARIKMLGNMVVPQQAYVLFREIMEVEM